MNWRKLRHNAKHCMNFVLSTIRVLKIQYTYKANNIFFLRKSIGLLEGSQALPTCPFEKVAGRGRRETERCGRENGNTRRKICPSDTLSTTNSICTLRIEALWKTGCYRLHKAEFISSSGSQSVVLGSATSPQGFCGYISVMGYFEV